MFILHNNVYMQSQKKLRSGKVSLWALLRRLKSVAENGNIYFNISELFIGIVLILYLCYNV